MIWVLWLVLPMVRAEFFILSGPDEKRGDKWHSKQQARDMYCITDELSSALVWNANFEWIKSDFKNLNHVGKPYLLPRDVNYVYPSQDNLNCQMDQKSSCSRLWSTGNWSFVTSSTKPMSPISDNRWEGLEEIAVTKNSDYASPQLPSRGSLAVSIRGKGDAHFSLCPNTHDCYHISFGDPRNKKKWCAGNNPQGNCVLSQATNNDKTGTLSSTEWKTFLIQWDLMYKNEAEISVYEGADRFLSFSSKVLFPSALNKMVLYARSSDKMLMKFHTYGYLMTTSTQSKLLSPEIMTTSPDGSICIEMSLSLCENCQIFADFVDGLGQITPGRVFKGDPISNPYGLPTWKTVKVHKTLPSKVKQPIKLTINTLPTKTTSDKPYWAVSNVRRCYDGELKVVKMTAYQDDRDDSITRAITSEYFWPKVTCQKISATGSSIIESTNREFTTSILERRQLCTAGKIGEKCSVSCSKLFGERYQNCDSLQACDQQGCSCAPGFTKDSSCTSKCPGSKYGYECKMNCGHCTDGMCNPATGNCDRGCEFDEANVYLPPLCKTGISSPPPPNVDAINSSTVRLHAELKREYKLIPTSFVFEIWENSSKPVYVSHALGINSTTPSIEVFVEGLKPGTHYRTTGIITAKNKTLRGDWRIFTTSCTESPRPNFHIHRNETSITVDNVIEKHVNDSCPHTWYTVQLDKHGKKVFGNSTDFPKKFTELEPYTNYTVFIRSQKNPPIFHEAVTTLEGVPDAVENLGPLRSFPDSIDVRWNAPKVTRGDIVNYTAEIWLVESLGCLDMNVTTTEQLKVESATITNVTQGTYNYTFKDLKPYSRYRIEVYAGNSRHRGKKAELVYETTAIDISTELFANLRLTNKSSAKHAANLTWDRPENCTSITGPIRAARLFFESTLENNFLTVNTTDYFFPLPKSRFNGFENYTVKLHALRGLGDAENKTRFSFLEFTVPPREPPPVRDLEIVEVDPINQTTTLRWKKPEAPLHGELEYYSVGFCKKQSKDCITDDDLKAFTDESCGPWDPDGELCKTVDLPPADYEEVQIVAHNEDVSEGSEPVTLSILRKDFVPSAPAGLSYLLPEKSFTAQVSWPHPILTGGRLQRFDIEATVLRSTLKHKPWTSKTFQLDLTSYESWYTKDIELFPSTTFSVKVKAVTTTGLSGNNTETEISTPNLFEFSSKDLRPRIGDDLTVTIRIPKILNLVENNKIVVKVHGPKHCDRDQDGSNETSHDKAPLSWTAIEITNPDDYADREFKVGDGYQYGGGINYALCSNESYVVHALLIHNSVENSDERDSLQEYPEIEDIETHEIRFKEVPVESSFWYLLLLVVIILMVLMIFIIHRRKYPKKYLKGKQHANNLQENEPLSNNYQENGSHKKVVEKIELIKSTNSSAIDKAMKIVNQEEKFKTFTMPVKVEEFEEYFEHAYKSGDLEMEFLALKSGLTKPHSYGSKPEMKPKNRYLNLFPYDDTRVILEKHPDDPTSDYINASYIKGYGGHEKAYIATQGPKPSTVVDFWRMIWQDKVEVICMMANLVENEKIKCEQYWPSEVGKPVVYGSVTVKLTTEEVHSDFTYRTFVISCGGHQEPRSVQHLHYTAWPDHGVPSNPRSIVAFLREIQKYAPIPRAKEVMAPIVVHCSAGVGRTGTLIVLDMAICQIISEKVVDVRSLVASTRQDRLNMVHNSDQYLLVHLVLAEYLCSEDTCFVASDENLPKLIAEAKAKSEFHFQRIKDTSWLNEVLGSPPLPEKSLSNKNRTKHRFPNSAGSVNRLFLKRSIETDEDSDYIAATSVKGVFKDCRYISTQLPLPTTLADFWRMVSEQRVQLVLVLQQPDLNDPTYCELVPENQGFASTVYLRVIRQSDASTLSRYYYKEEVCIIDSSEQPNKDQTVTIINYNNWPRDESSLPPPGELVRLWRTLKSFNRTETVPVVVVCRDGLTASGLWLTASYLLNKMTIDNECDVPQAVREIRRCKKDFLNKPEHFSYLYDVALAHGENNMV